jgi:hypothetical protein
MFFCHFIKNGFSEISLLFTLAVLVQLIKSEPEITTTRSI